MSTLKATQASIKATMGRVEQAQEVAKATGETLKYSSDLIDNRMDRAKAALDFATERICVTLGQPSSKPAMLHKAMELASLGASNSSVGQFGQLGLSGGNCTNSTSTKGSKGEVELD